MAATRAGHLDVPKALCVRVHEKDLPAEKLKAAQRNKVSEE